MSQHNANHGNKYMQTSLYELKFKDGRTFRVFCANRKQNKDMLSLITYVNINGKSKFKRNGITVLANGITTFINFKKQLYA